MGKIDEVLAAIRNEEKQKKPHPALAKQAWCGEGIMRLLPGKDHAHAEENARKAYTSAASGGAKGSRIRSWYA
jgi:hypothetical protein